ncbi:UDP-glycosyltransferase 75C1-like [Magnolia sinica]|uniref:UDP-glycosyltransferase 75C1-like n=1 Tax=Magnolia sinica TaxID=86752 RepID=UPI002659A680|nr:UDP-glycosyltransferase 75C1-like [Magnolia sinica]
MAHFLLLAYHMPGHINPALQFAQRLIHAGARVTFLTTVYAYRRMIKSTPPEGLSYATFSDGYDDGPSPTADLAELMAQFRQHGSEALADLMRTLANERRPVTCVVYTLLLQWAADVARSLNTPNVLLWIQPATVFAIYYHYFHGYDDLIVKSIEKGPSSSIKLPGLPPLTSKELPSFIIPSASYVFMAASFREQFERLDKEERPRVLINTFDEGEPDSIRAVDGVDQISVGPFFPPEFFDGKNLSHATDGGEMYKNSRNYIEWLDSKPASTVVYVSFGSMVVLPNNQKVEILNGLLESNRPFLWIIRPTENGAGMNDETEFWEKVRMEMERKEGMVVPWCLQLEVLSHSSVGCFISHCGWNSTTESLAAGIPIVCLPCWTDQTSNAKLVEDIWKAGVRAKANGEGVFEHGEVKRCLDLVMGEGGEGIRRNALRWRQLARDAVREGGSSDQNVRAFVMEMTGESGPRDCNGDVQKTNGERERIDDEK